MKELTDYTLDHAGRDWAHMLAPWGDLLPERFDIFMVNRFGDLVVILSDGAVHMLDVGACVFPRLAGNLDEFVDQLPAYARNWLLAPLVDECVAAGLALGPDDCYSFKTPPLMGGAYALANVGVTSMSEHYRFMGEIHRQTRDLPDGAQVRARFAQF